MQHEHFYFNFFFFNLTILRNDAAIVKYVENVDEEIE